MIKYKDKPDDYQPFVVFNFIEHVLYYEDHYKNGIVEISFHDLKDGEFNQFVRFGGISMYYAGDDKHGNISLTDDIQDAVIFYNDDEATETLTRLAKSIKNRTIKYDGIQVIEYDEAHKKSSEVLQYPNEHYVNNDYIQPVKIYHHPHYSEFYQNILAKKRNKKQAELLNEINTLYCAYNQSDMKPDEVEYLYHCDNNKLQCILNKNRGRNYFDVFVYARHR